MTDQLGRRAFLAGVAASGLLTGVAPVLDSRRFAKWIHATSRRPFSSWFGGDAGPEHKLS